jgi:hypothetical protein
MPGGIPSYFDLAISLTNRPNDAYRDGCLHLECDCFRNWVKELPGKSKLSVHFDIRYVI